MTVKTIYTVCKSMVFGQFSYDGIGCKTRVKLVSSHWSVLIGFDLAIVSQIKSVCQRSICGFCSCHDYVVCKVLVAVNIC